MSKIIKSLLVACAVLFSLSVIGADRLEKFCGIKMGGDVNKRHRYAGQMDNGVHVYLFKPRKRFMQFTQYAYTATPTSKKVLSVFISKTFKDRASCEGDFKRIVTALEAKYKIAPQHKREINANEYTFQFKDTDLTVRAEIGIGQHKIIIQCLDLPTCNIAEKEVKEHAIKSVDTSAL